MIIAKTKPVGIDKTIKRIQEVIEPKLKREWSPDLKVYGRAYIKRTEKEPSLEIFTGKGEYEPILHSEGNKIFFVQSEESTSVGSGLMRSDIWIIAVLNLDEVKEGYEQRADEEVHEDLLVALRGVINTKRINSLLTGTENLKRITKDIFKYGAFKFSDIHPYHVFMIKANVDYYYNC